MCLQFVFVVFLDHTEEEASSYSDTLPKEINSFKYVFNIIPLYVLVSVGSVRSSLKRTFLI